MAKIFIVKLRKGTPLSESTAFIIAHKLATEPDLEIEYVYVEEMPTEIAPPMAPEPTEYNERTHIQVYECDELPPIARFKREVRQNWENRNSIRKIRKKTHRQVPR